MQHLSAFLALLLVAFASAAPSQPVEQPSSGQSGPSVPVVGNSPAQQAPVVGAASSNIEAPQPSVGVIDQSVGVHQFQHQHQHPHQFQGHHSQVQPGVVGASHYAPAAGIIQVVGAEQQIGGQKPVVAPVVRGVEQYGQPESASLPANYKPFGSWGLYIGGNPADGYYTNYYKALSNSVDQQQAGEPVKPTAALSPILRQASSSPYVGADYYPFAYSPADLNSGAHAQVHGAPNSFDSSYQYANQVSPYADAYATKKVGTAYTQQKEAAPVKEITTVKEAAPVVQAPAPATPSKGYQSRVYVYPPVGTLSAPLQPASPAQSSQVQYGAQSHQTHQAQGQQAQVVAYPVPVGSQIVGSQQGVEGAFNPYGIHAFTRYAVKPTVVNQDASYYYGIQGAQQLPTYKQQQAVYSPVPVSQAGYYPLGFYGYPVNQLHYSQGSILPQGAGYPEFQHQQQYHQHQHQAAPGYPFESGVEKAENEENKPVNKPQK